jgi:hypothetical protein
MIVIWNKDKEMDWTKPSVYPIHREHSYRIKNSFFRVSGISANSFKRVLFSYIMFIILIFTQQLDFSTIAIQS